MLCKKNKINILNVIVGGKQTIPWNLIIFFRCTLNYAFQFHSRMHLVIICI